MSFESITEIWTYCTQRDVVWEHYRNLNLLHSTRCRLRALQKSERIALNEMSFESITEIWTYCTQRDVVWEHYRNLNLLHSTRCRLRALQKSELIALNEMSFESITEILTYCINEMSFESITEIWTYCTQRDVVWEHYRNLNLLHSTRCRLRALQKSELIALNEMSFESITEIWTYCTQRDVVWEHYRNLNLLHSTNVVWEHYRNLNLLQSTRCRLRALQKSESITEICISLNDMTFALQLNLLRALQKSERIALNDMTFESITEIWTYCTQRDVVREHYRNLNLLHSTRYRSRALQKS